MLSRTNSNYINNVTHDDLPIAKMSRSGRLCDDLYSGFDTLVWNKDYDEHLMSKINLVFRTTVYFSMAPLATVSFDLESCHPVNAVLQKGVSHLPDLERLDNCINALHW